MSRWLLCQIVPDHAGVLARLHAQCFEDAWDASAMVGLLHSPGVVGLTGGDAKDPLGFILARAAVDEAEILSIGVLPAARGGGLGAALLTGVLDRLASVGVTSVFLEVAVSNHLARALYTRAGFVPAGLRKGYYAKPGAPGEDALVMRLSLEPLEGEA